MSFTLFLGSAASFWAAYGLLHALPAAGPAAAWGLAAGLLVVVVSPLYAGACSVAYRAIAHRIVAEEELGYLDLWRAARRLYGRAAAVGAAQLAGSALFAANIGFYVARHGIAFLLLAAIFGYLSLFWLMNCAYHWPLLVAADLGIIERDEGDAARLSSVFRNAFVLAASSPGFTFALLLAIIVPAAPLVISGVGMALLLPGYVAFITMEATRTQLVRFGLLPPAPDPDAPLNDPGFRT